MEKELFYAHLARLREVFPDTEVITIPQAAAFYGCDPRTLRSDKTLKAKKFGSEYRVPVINFARWLAG